MEDTSLIRLAFSRGFIHDSQLESLRQEQAEFAERGLDRSLWYLVCEHKLLTEVQQCELRKALEIENLRGRIVANHRIIRRLGKGEMGEVFLCEDMHGVKVAMKMLTHPNVRNPEAKKYFQRESVALKMLENPYIIRGISSGDEDGDSYLIMEYVDGQSLMDRIDKLQLLDSSQALIVLVHGALGLRHAWRCGVLHRDVKPANILLATPRVGYPEPFCCKICDFGLARSYFSDSVEQGAMFKSNAGQIIGTPNYMSPEQFDGNVDLDQRTDIFSLAATVFHAVVGQPIQTVKNINDLMWQRQHDEIDLSPLAGRGLSQRFINLLGKMLCRQRSQRIQDWDWVLHECLHVNPDIVKQFLDNQPGFAAPISANVEMDSSRRLAELTSSRVAYLSESIDIKLSSVQLWSQNDTDSSAIADIRHDLANVRALAQNLEVMVGEKPADRMRIDLKELSSNVSVELKCLSDKLQVNLIVEGEGNASGDMVYSHIALLNLVRNGVLACRMGGFVKIGMRDNTLTITDQGHGIPRSILTNLFDPISPKRVFGLGVTAARICQRRQGGEVRLLMTGEQGTTFGVFWTI